MNEIMCVCDYPLCEDLLINCLYLNSKYKKLYFWLWHKKNKRLLLCQLNRIQLKKLSQKNKINLHKYVLLVCTTRILLCVCVFVRANYF